MSKELIEILEESYEAGYITSSAKTQIDSLKRSLQLSDNDFRKLEDGIRIGAYLKKVKEREKKGVTFFGDLRKQYRISDEDSLLIQEKTVSRKQPKSPPPQTLPAKPVEEQRPQPQARLSEAMRKSEALKGASITPSIPSRQTAAQTPASNRKKTSPGSIIVLFADDNDAQLAIARKIIEDCGCSCLTAATPEETLSVIYDQRPSIVFCDVNFGIGKKTGMDIFIELQKNNIVIPFVIVSAFIQNEFKMHAQKIGVSDYLIKPITSEQIEGMINKLVRR